MEMPKTHNKNLGKREIDELDDVDDPSSRKNRRKSLTLTDTALSERQRRLEETYKSLSDKGNICDPDILNMLWAKAREKMGSVEASDSASVTQPEAMDIEDFTGKYQNILQKEINKWEDKLTGYHDEDQGKLKVMEYKEKKKQNELVRGEKLTDEQGTQLKAFEKTIIELSQQNEQAAKDLKEALKDVDVLADESKLKGRKFNDRTRKEFKEQSEQAGPIYDQANKIWQNLQESMENHGVNREKFQNSKNAIEKCKSMAKDYEEKDTAWEDMGRRYGYLSVLKEAIKDLQQMNTQLQPFMPRENA